MKEFVIKDSPSFQLKIKKQECLFPKDLYAVNFIRCTKDKDGNIDSESTYEFFMDYKDLTKVAAALIE
jgi:hypothetical protein